MSYVQITSNSHKSQELKADVFSVGRQQNGLFDVPAAIELMHSRICIQRSWHKI